MDIDSLLRERVKRSGKGKNDPNNYQGFSLFDIDIRLIAVESIIHTRALPLVLFYY